MSTPLFEQATELKGMIEAANTILIVPHLNPDGDAIGSALGLAIGLQRVGKEVTVCCNDLPPRNLRFLPEYNSVKLPRELADDYTPDLAIIVDVNHLPRLGGAQPFVAAAKQRAIVDHHQLGHDVIEGHLVVHPEYAACAVLVFDLFPMLGLELDKQNGQCLLTGIVTDTGNFRFPNTDTKSMQTAIQLMELGCSLRMISEEVFEKKSVNALKMLSIALSKMQLFDEGEVVVSSLAHEDYMATGVLDEETENIVNEIGRVSTSKAFALFREPNPGKVRASVRSRGAIDVAAVCYQFGGGGHANSSGCTFEMGLDAAMNLMIPALREAVRNSAK
ncbi:MAG: bifunctional oligoribonuclease/PAP phosphatase NrnA [Fimbriimonadales bacterium]